VELVYSFSPAIFLLSRGWGKGVRNKRRKGERTAGNSSIPFYLEGSRGKGDSKREGTGGKEKKKQSAGHFSSCASALEKNCREKKRRRRKGGSSFCMLNRK